MKNRTIKLDSEEVNIFFSSDHHFMHRNIIEFCDRPFKDIIEMNETLVKNWNKVVNPKDHIFILGDFCFGGKKEWLYLLDALNGNKYLTYGNHDLSVAGNFLKEDNILNLLIRDPEIKDGQRISLCHYPMLSWYQSMRGAWMLFGHLHGKATNDFSEDNKYDIRRKMSPNHLDVGVDAHNFFPISYQEVKTIITKQNLKQ